MTAARPRYRVTETEQVARALERAARRWPGESRSELLLRLVAAGSAALQQGEDEEAQRAAIAASSGASTDAPGPHHLQTLREDWPA